VLSALLYILNSILSYIFMLVALLRDLEQLVLQSSYMLLQISSRLNSSVEAAGISTRVRNTPKITIIVTDSLKNHGAEQCRA